MRLDKWRIRKRNGEWRIFRPGRRFVWAAAFDTHHDAVAMLPSIQRWEQRGFR